MVIVGASRQQPLRKRLFQTTAAGNVDIREVENINAYLIAGRRIIVDAMSRALDDRAYMIRGNMPSDGGHLLLSEDENLNIEGE